MSDMSEGERLIWAATYAVRWSQSIKERELLGITPAAATSAEEACAAVFDLRETQKLIELGWDPLSAEVAMIDQILND